MLRYDDLLRVIKMDQAMGGSGRDGCFGNFDNPCQSVPQRREITYLPDDFIGPLTPDQQYEKAERSI